MVETGYEQIHMPLIGDDAPSFTAVTTQGQINFPEERLRTLLFKNKGVRKYRSSEKVFKMLGKKNKEF